MYHYKLIRSLYVLYIYVEPDYFTFNGYFTAVNLNVFNTHFHTVQRNLFEFN